MAEERMEDMKEAVEASYKYMGDGEHDTDTLLAWENAQALLESGEAVTVTVNEEVKGGVLTELDGLRAFIPFSKLSLGHVDDAKEFIGKPLRVQVITAEMEGSKLVLSAVGLLKKERAAKMAEEVAKVSIGAVMKGTVETIKDYGAFVRLENGLSGLVHVSQISVKRVANPAAVLKEGQEVEVKVINVKDGKISLSMKALEEGEADEVEPTEKIELPTSEGLGTSLGDLLKGLNL